VRSEVAIERHWQLVCCAFTFCWWNWFRVQTGVPPEEDRMDQTGKGIRVAITETEIAFDTYDASPNLTALTPGLLAVLLVTWPRSLRLVRSWLTPWTYIRLRVASMVVQSAASRPSAASRRSLYWVPPRLHAPDLTEYR
jgi:hypothetical protein